MTLHRKRPRRRGGFTFIELIISIAIIALLISLLASGVVLALTKVDQAKAQREVGGLASAVKQFESDFNISVPPPSRIRLYQNLGNYTAATADQLDADSWTFLRKVWPRIGGASPSTAMINWGPNNTGGNYLLEGQECLVFFLGGRQVKSANGLWAGIGFSADPTNPMNPSTTIGAKGPYYQFESPRLSQAGTAGKFLQYADPYGTPYAYFSSGKSPNGYNAYYTLLGNKYDCATLGNFGPYYQAGVSPIQYYNADTFQIISAGKDGKFGPGGAWSPLSGPAGTAPNGADDVSNFYDSRLGVTP
jgi:prepilin-type N-terminal cleavage/methylation domain-containing protein